MPFNFPGVLAPLHVLVNPRLAVPALVVKDIRQLDFSELYRAGYRGAVFDKDNCLTVPHRDELVPVLKEAWEECRRTFGENNILIVSNTAGSHLDGGEIQAESVTHHLQAPVLRHSSLKPSYSCIKAIRAYFGSLPTPVEYDELIVVGDRVFTDVIMGNRMAHAPWRHSQAAGADPEKATIQRSGPMPILTTQLWKRDQTVFRWMEKGVIYSAERWVLDARELASREELRRKFVRELPVPESPPKAPGLVQRLWGLLAK